jgi:hypothetical protein
MLFEEIQPLRKVSKHVDFGSILLLVNVVLVAYRNIKNQISMEVSMLTTQRSIIPISGPSLSIKQVNAMVLAAVWCLSDAPQMNMLELKSA